VFNLPLSVAVSEQPHWHWFAFWIRLFGEYPTKIQHRQSDQKGDEPLPAQFPSFFNHVRILAATGEGKNASCVGSDGAMIRNHSAPERVQSWPR
jgi:hypothetical protein